MIFFSFKENNREAAPSKAQPLDFIFRTIILLREFPL